MVVIPKSIAKTIGKAYLLYQIATTPLFLWSCPMNSTEAERYNNSALVEKAVLNDYCSSHSCFDTYQFSIAEIISDTTSYNPRSKSLEATLLFPEQTPIIYEVKWADNVIASLSRK